MPVETTFKDYLTESWSLDQMQMVENELMGLFRYTARMGWGENDTDMDARLVIFAGEIDPQLVHNHLIGTGWKYVESADPEDPTVMYKGYVRGSVDLLVKRGNLNIAAGVNGVAQAMPGHFIGIYADQIFSTSDRYEDETMGDEGDTGEDDETGEDLTEGEVGRIITEEYNDEATAKKMADRMNKKRKTSTEPHHVASRQAHGKNAAYKPVKRGTKWAVVLDDGKGDTQEGLLDTDPEIQTISEAMKVNVDVRQWSSANSGKNPSGRGNWFIGLGKKDIDFKTDKEDEHYIVHNGPYKEAVKKAMLRAKELGKTTVYALS